MTAGERRAKNEAIFRAVNQKLTEMNQAVEGLTGTASGFICECDDLYCDAQVAVTIDDFRRIHSNERLFIVKPGHEGPPEYERVVEQGDAFFVVEKHPVVADRAADDLKD